MKTLMYAIAFIAVIPVASASRAIASSPSDLLTTGNSPAIRQINLVSQRVQLSIDPAVPSPAAQATTPVSTAAKKICKGDAVRDKPPIPNYPSHIRNVIWGNIRTMCLEQIAHQTSTQPINQR